MSKAVFPETIGNESQKPQDGGTRSASDIRNALSALFQGDFAPLRARAQDSPDMTVKVNSAVIQGYFAQVNASGQSVSFSGGNSSAISAPSSNPRIDILYLDPGAGTLGWVTGTESASPVANWSGLPEGAIPICLVYCKTTMTKIVNYEDKDANPNDGYIYQDVRPIIGGGSGSGGGKIKVDSDDSLDYLTSKINLNSVPPENLVIKNVDELYTKLLLHCNGIDGSTTFTDSSAYGKTVTANGNAQIDTAQKKFGTASGLFDGSGDYLSIADSDDWNFGTSDFTIDFWVRLNSFQGVNGAIFGQGTDGSNLVQFYYDSTNNRWFFAVAESGTSEIQLLGSDTISLNTWYHIAIVRNGDVWKLYRDGTELATQSKSYTYPNYTSTFVIGARNWGTIDRFFDGWIDEFRVSKGIARWTSSFTPPTSEYTAENPDYQLNISADKIIVEGRLLTSFSQTIDLTASGAGGLDTGSEASSTWYYIWLITNNDGSSSSAIFSTSSSSPTLPSGYTKKRLVGAIYNDSSGDLRRVRIYGDGWHWFTNSNGRIAVYEGATLTSSYASYDISSIIPTGCNELSLLTGSSDPNYNNFQIISFDGDVEVLRSNDGNSGANVASPYNNTQSKIAWNNGQTLYAKLNYSSYANQSCYIRGYKLSIGG